MRALRPGGGTGRRTRFRVWRPQNRGGSNPLLGTDGPAARNRRPVLFLGAAPPRGPLARARAARRLDSAAGMHVYAAPCISIRPRLSGASGYTGLELTRLLARHPRDPRRRALLRSLGGRGRRGPAAARRTGRGAAVPAPRRGRARRRRARVPRDAGRGVRRARAEAARAGRPGGRPLRRVPARGRRRRTRPGTGSRTPRPRSSPRRATGCPSSRGSGLAGARLVTNPGCYATAIALALAPLVKAGLGLEGGIAVTGLSGVVGRRAQGERGLQLRRDRGRPARLPARASTSTSRRSSRPSRATPARAARSRSRRCSSPSGAASSRRRRCGSPGPRPRRSPTRSAPRTSRSRSCACSRPTR